MDFDPVESDKYSITELEAQLATLFVGNHHVREIRYQQELVRLLQQNPIILNASLKIDSTQTESFVLLLIKQVLEYSLNYQHEIYKPYRPRDQAEKSLLEQVISKHFDHLGPMVMEFFSIRDDNLNELIGSSKKSENEEDIDFCPVPDLRDPGLKEDLLQELWMSANRIDSKVEDELVGGYPSWARGIILDMKRTSYLFKKFKESDNRIFISREDIKYQPHHLIINILIATEFYWVFNKREVSLHGKMTNAELYVAIKDYLHTLADQFLRLLPENHPYRKRVSAEERRDWDFERIRGILGAKKLSGIYKQTGLRQKIECTEYTVNLKSEPVKDFLPSGMKSKKLVIKEFSNHEIENYNYTDPGLDEEFLWELYGVRFKKSIKWDFEVDKNWPTWAKGILGSMASCNRIYEEFKRSRHRTKKFQNRRFQPHHVNIKVLIAAEYFWLFNSREVKVTENVNFLQVKIMQKQHIYDIYDGFLQLLKSNHPEHTRASRLDRELEWSVEKIRGSSGASKVAFLFHLGEKSWLVETTASSIVTKPIKKNNPESP